MKVIRLPELTSRIGLSKSQVYKMCRRGSFPKPMKLGPRASAWVEEEVNQWMLSKIHQRDS